MKNFTSFYLFPFSFWFGVKKQVTKESPCPVVTAKDFQALLLLNSIKISHCFCYTWFNKDGKG
jgi:hypothetical protein